MAPVAVGEYVTCETTADVIVPFEQLVQLVGIVMHVGLGWLPVRPPPVTPVRVTETLLGVAVVLVANTLPWPSLLIAMATSRSTDVPTQTFVPKFRALPETGAAPSPSATTLSAAMAVFVMPVAPRSRPAVTA